MLTRLAGTAALGMLSAGAAAAATSFSLQITAAGFTAPQLEGGQDASTGVTAFDLDGLPGVERLEFGTPADGLPSAIAFAPVAAISGGAGETTAPLGTFTHDNFPTVSGALLEAATLSIQADLTVGDQVFRDLQFTYGVSIDNTPNIPTSGTCAVGLPPCPDIVSFAPQQVSATVQAAGAAVTLEILGVAQDGRFVTSFATAEGARTTAQVIGAVTVPPALVSAAVPLPPAAWAMLAALAALVPLRRR